MKAYWEWRYSFTHSSTSALDGGEWSASRPGRFTPRESTPGTHWIGGWIGSRAVLDAVVKRKIPSPRRESNPRTPIVQPVAQRYTDWAITPLVASHVQYNIKMLCLETNFGDHINMWDVRRRMSDIQHLIFTDATCAHKQGSINWGLVLWPLYLGWEGSATPSFQRNESHQCAVYIPT
jgi:hypothetical protein